MIWVPVTKADARVRAMADRHYTRQTPGAPLFTRPGFNFVLHYDDGVVQGGFVWWRPKWEAGTRGTERGDKIRAIECTLFRREGPKGRPRSSELIRAAVSSLLTPDASHALHYDTCGPVDPVLTLITAVGIAETSASRSPHVWPGHCFSRAGWRHITDPRRPSINGKVWLHLPYEKVLRG